jgi:uncharacterized membrane protein YraQ (UPF0718 family)
MECEMFTDALYLITGLLLLISFVRDRQKTKTALLKGWRSFENILPLFLSIILIIGMSLAVLSPQVISGMIGQHSGWVGVVLAAAIGSITLIPGFVTFPLAASLLKNGAGLTPITVFISTSMMVGVVTMPVERKYFGKRATIIRNFLALAFSGVVALVLRLVLQ